jgi:hypothetical protein
MVVAGVQIALEPQRFQAQKDGARPLWPDPMVPAGYPLVYTRRPEASRAAVTAGLTAYFLVDFFADFFVAFFAGAFFFAAFFAGAFFVATGNPPLLTGGLRSGPRYYLEWFTSLRNTFLCKGPRSGTDICFLHYRVRAVKCFPDVPNSPL